MLVQKEVKNMYIGEYPPKWRPDANTLAYFPLKTNQLDKVGNASISPTGTQQTIGYYFDCNSSQNVDASGIPQNVCFASMWGQRNRRATTNDTIGFVTNDGGLRFCRYHTTSSTIGKFLGVTSNNVWLNIGSSRSVPQNTRMHIAGGWKDGVYRAYINGALVGSGSATPRAYTYDGHLILYANNGGAITLSDVIMESEMWTDAQVADYYNLTKGKYGIS